MTLTRSSGIMVKPSENSPSGNLNLSSFDRLPQLRVNASLLFVYRHGHQEAARVFRESLSKVLVSYHPLAGRIVESSNGELQVACTREGVWFIEAAANYSLDSVNFFDNVFMNLQDLLPTPPPESYRKDPLVQFQLTRFVGEGFVLGLTFCHSIMDGIGLVQFLNAIAEFARASLQPSIAPVWHREAIPAPTWLVRAPGETKLPPPPAPSQSFHLERGTIDISLEQINKLKKSFSEFTGEYCSTFDVVVASLWQNRTRAINMEKQIEVNLIFTVNARKFLNPPLPDGYYGNCLYQLTVTTVSGLLVDASHAEVVKLIKDAKGRVPTEFLKIMKSDELEDGVNPLGTPVSYTTLCITDWSGIGFNEIDYGWGNPENVIPANKGFGIMPSAVVGLSPSVKKGIRLMTWCVNHTDLESLVHCFYEYGISRL